MITTGVNQLCIVVLAAAMLLAAAQLSAAEQTTLAVDEKAQWQAQGTENGIAIYTREITGSPYLEVKAVMTLNASADVIVSAFGDGDGCAEWRMMCESSEVLEIVSDNERVVHLVMDMPWPISDRDLVMRSVHTIDEEAAEALVVLTPASDHIPAGEHIRAQASGSYLVKMHDEDTAAVTYVIHTDLGGDLSPGLVNSRLIDATMDDMQRLKVMAESEG